MDRTDFQIIFDKLAEAGQENSGLADFAKVSETTSEELDEIAELRRLSSELAAPDIVCFTTT